MRISLLLTFLLLISSVYLSKSQSVIWANEIKSSTYNWTNYSYILYKTQPLIDAYKDVWVVLGYRDSVQIENTVIKHNGKDAFAVCKFDSNGNFLWAANFTSPAGDVTLRNFHLSKDNNMWLLMNFKDSLYKDQQKIADKSRPFENSNILYLDQQGNSHIVFDSLPSFNMGVSFDWDSDLQGNIIMNISTGYIGYMFNDTSLQKMQNMSLVRFDKNGKMLARVQSKTDGAITSSDNGKHFVNYKNFVRETFILGNDTFSNNILGNFYDYIVIVYDSVLNPIYWKHYDANVTYHSQNDNILTHKTFDLDDSGNLYMAISYGKTITIENKNYGANYENPIWMKLNDTGGLVWLITHNDSFGGAYIPFLFLENEQVVCMFSPHNLMNLNGHLTDNTGSMLMRINKAGQITYINQWVDPNVFHLQAIANTDGESIYIMSWDSFYYHNKWMGNGKEKVALVKLGMSQWNYPVAQINSTQLLSAYPNPAGDFINIPFLNSENISGIVIYNMEGKIIKKCPYSNNIDISDLRSGMYYMQAEKKDTISYNIRFVKN